MHSKIHNIGTSIIAVAFVCAVGWQLVRSANFPGPVSTAEAAGGVVKGPNEIAPDRYVSASHRDAGIGGTGNP